MAQEQPDTAGVGTGALVARRLGSQLLAGPRARSVVEVAQRLLAVQAQDPRGFRLAVRSRSVGLSAADVERALTVDRSVVVDTLNRGTLHLVPAEDLGWLHALTTPQLLTSSSRRLAQEGVSPGAAERGVAAVERALGAEGPLDRHALRERIAAAGVPTAGQALAHVLMLASLRGLVVRGPVVDGHHAFVLRRDWLGPLGRPWTGDREAALTRLAQRYLAGHGPAGERDLAKWAGIPLGQARRGMRSLGDRIRQVHGGGGLVELTATAPVPGTGGDGGRDGGGGSAGDGPADRGPQLLGAFDPLLLGWVDRSPVTGGNTAFVTDNGLFRPFALVEGRAVATWGLAGGAVTLHPFEPLTDDTAAALAVDAVAVSRFLG